MVIISAAVLSKSGKVLLSRQFVPINKTHIEGYLACFPRLISADNQHTIIDTEQIRYIYQPLENLYILLITNKQSNIIEDTNTLGLISKIIPDCCLASTEEAVRAHVFDLISSFDELIQCNGHKEAVTIQQIKTCTQMDSEEEKLSLIIRQNKEEEAKKTMLEKSDSIQRQREQRKKI